MRASGFIFALVAISSVVAHPLQFQRRHHPEEDLLHERHHPEEDHLHGRDHPEDGHHHERRDLHIVGRHQSVKIARASTTEFDLISNGNKAFREGIATSDPELLKKLADDGQTPPFMFLGCSDSRVSEGTVFNAKPGTFFTQRNIANQFQSTDVNAQSVLAYGVSELGVKHVIVMGHYGCGGVAAAIASAPGGQVDAANGAVQGWIQPIREIFATSTRPEIVELRTKNAGKVVEEPDIKEPGFRALVEENVKSSVHKIAGDSVISNHYAALSAGNVTIVTRSGEEKPLTDVFVHGWVYDIETGEVRDLGISVGPPGKEIPTPPFEAVAKSAEDVAAAHGTPEPKVAVVEPPQKRCEQLCKAKRTLAGMFPAW